MHVCGLIKKKINAIVFPRQFYIKNTQNLEVFWANPKLQCFKGTKSTFFKQNRKHMALAQHKAYLQEIPSGYTVSDLYAPNICCLLQFSLIFQQLH